MHVQQVLEIPNAGRAKALGQARSSQRLVSRKASSGCGSSQKQNPEYGYRMIWATLRQEAVEVNVKRVRRLWKQAGLKVVRPKPERVPSNVAPQPAG